MSTIDTFVKFSADSLYKELIARGVPEEQARAHVKSAETEFGFDEKIYNLVLKADTRIISESETIKNRLTIVIALICLLIALSAFRIFL